MEGWYGLKNWTSLSFNLDSFSYILASFRLVSFYFFVLCQTSFARLIYLVRFERSTYVKICTSQQTSCSSLCTQAITLLNWRDNICIGPPLKLVRILPFVNQKLFSLGHKQSNLPRQVDMSFHLLFSFFCRKWARSTSKTWSQSWRRPTRRTKASGSETRLSRTSSKKCKLEYYVLDVQGGECNS